MTDGVRNPGNGLAAQFRRGSISLIGSLFILAAVLIWFVVRKAHYVTDYSLSSYSDYYWPRRLGLVLHLTGGFIAITTGIVQLWLGFTGQTRGLHRALGRIYVCAIVLGVSGGAYMCATIPGHLAYRVGLAGLDIAWVATTAMAILAIKRRDIVQHRAWMVRSYTVTFAFVTFRLFYDLLIGFFPAPDAAGFGDLDTIMAWARWAVPLLAAEVLIQLPAMRKPSAESA